MVAGKFFLSVSLAACVMVAAATLSPLLAGAARTGEAMARPADACSGSTASVRQLAVIDHTSFGGFQCLGVAVDGGRVKAIRLEQHIVTPAEGGPERERVRVLEFPAAVVASPRGAVIDGVPGHDAIVLRGDFSPDAGRLVLSYLYNGITGEYRSCPIALDRVQGQGWRLINRSDQPVSTIGVRLREMPVIGVVGIDRLEGACT